MIAISLWFPKCSCLKYWVRTCSSLQKITSNHYYKESICPYIKFILRALRRVCFVKKNIRCLSLLSNKEEIWICNSFFSLFKLKSFSSVLNKPKEILRQTFCIITFPRVICMIVFTKAPFSPSWINMHFISLILKQQE